MPGICTRLVTFTLFITLFASCGDAFMKKKSKTESRNQFVQCDMNMKALSLIFEEKIKGDLLCLKENLNLFMDVVKTARPGNLSLVELKLYIKKNIQDIDPSIFDLLDAIFEMNSLVLGDDKKYIKRGNVDKLVELFIGINETVVDNRVVEYYSSKDRVTYQKHNERKAMVFQALSKVGSLIIDISVVNNNEIDFHTFLGNFEKIETDPDTQKVLKNLTKLLYVKKMFLGGDEKMLNSRELRRLARMLPDIAKVTFDLSNLNKIDHSENEEEEIIETLSVGARSLVKNLYYQGSDEPIMNFQDIFNTIDIFGTESVLKWFSYKKEILLAKEVLLETNSEVFSASEVYKLFDDILNKNLEKGVFIYKTYRLNKTQLDSPSIITEDLRNVVDIGPNDSDYMKAMNRIVKKYMFFKGRDPIAKFSRSIKRSPLGILEISFIEDMVRRINAGKARQMLRMVGSNISDLQRKIIAINNDDSLSRREKRKAIQPILEKIEAQNNLRSTVDSRQLSGEGMTQETILALFDDYGKILVAEDLITAKREANTAETITLMTSMFQSQSNGDGFIEVGEMTEFAVELMGGMNTASMGQEYFSKVCENVEPNSNNPARFMPECFRLNFMEFLEQSQNDVKLADHLPGLVTYLNDENVDADKYLQISEGFTRSCTHFDDGRAVPYTEGEMLLLFTGMFAVEQTFARFDVNNNNILDEEEVSASFVVYEEAIKALIPVDFLKGRAKDFYLYLMKYKALPDVQNVTGLRSLWRAIKEGAKFAAFVAKSSRNKSSKADRETIATILKTLSELSPEATKNPFPCELLELE